MRRHPVQQHADVRLVQGVDEVTEVVGRAVPRRRCEVPGYLIAPRPVEGVLHHRQQFHVRKAHPPHMVHQPRRNFAIRHGPVALFGDTGPCAEVYFIDVHRLAHLVAGAARRHPRVVAPVVRVLRHHDRRRVRRRLHLEPHGIGLEAQQSFAGAKLELVERIRRHARNEELPQSAALHAAHRELAAVPVAPVAHDARPFRVGGPHDEPGALVAVDGAQVCAEHGPELAVRALVEEVQVHLAHRGLVTIGVAPLPRAPVGRKKSQRVVHRPRYARHHE